MVGSPRASVSSGISLSLKASFYAIDTPLVTATIVATISQKAKTSALAGLKTTVSLSHDDYAQPVFQRSPHCRMANKNEI